MLSQEEKINSKHRNISIVQDIDGNKIVIINDILFKGRRTINWNDVEQYLKGFVGEFYTIENSMDIIYLGSELPSEYTGSLYTKSLKGAAAKAKANAAQGIPELIKTATKPSFQVNKKRKHQRNAKFGWYRYEARFALPVYNKSNEIERYNIFNAGLLVRHASSGKKYLYDIIEIKKEKGDEQVLSDNNLTR